MNPVDRCPPLHHHHPRGNLLRPQPLTWHLPLRRLPFQRATSRTVRLAPPRHHPLRIVAMSHHLHLVSLLVLFLTASEAHRRAQRQPRVRRIRRCHRAATGNPIQPGNNSGCRWLQLLPTASNFNTRTILQHLHFCCLLCCRFCGGTSRR